MSVSDDDPRPRYIQIADALRKQITSGVFEPGQRLTTARDLAHEYGVSVVTAQKAVELLKNEGFLETVGGRGIFVASETTDEREEPASGEYLRIMEHIGQLRTAVQEQLSRIDKRLSDLESVIRSTESTPPPSSSDDPPPK